MGKSKVAPINAAQNSRSAARAMKRIFESITTGCKGWSHLSMNTFIRANSNEQLKKYNIIRRTIGIFDLPIRVLSLQLDVLGIFRIRSAKLMARRRSMIPIERIERLIFVIRGHKVMLDADLSELYGVETKALNRAFARNRNRFPSDFAFRLSDAEFQDLRCQFDTSRWGGRRYLPYAFTEQGVAMLSGILHSRRAVQVNIAIMRTFVQLRRLLVSNAELARKLEALEKKHDARFKIVFDALRELMTPPEPKQRKIGFLVRERAARYGTPSRQTKIG
jgi:hypothetical protein